MDLRNKIFWGVFYSLVYGYLRVGLIWQNETPMDSLRNFPLQFKEQNLSSGVVKEIAKEVSKPI